MTWQVTLILTIILIILGIGFKKSKIIFLMQSLWVWLLLAGNTGGADYLIHVRYYTSSIEGIQIFSSAWLYKLLAYPFAINGIDFSVFNMIMATLSFSIIIFYICKKTSNVSFVMSLFMIFPLADSIIQKRNFLASAIFLIGLSKYLNDMDLKKNRIILIICTLIAAQIHASFYAYLLIIPLMSLKKKNFNYFFTILLSVFFLLIPFIPKIAEVILSGTSLYSKINLYFSQLKIPFYQSCCWWMLHIIFVFLFNSLNNQNKKDISLMNYNKYNIITLIFMPLYYYEPTFFRFYRNTLIINYSNVGTLLERKYKLTKNKFSLNILIVSFILCVFLSQFVFFGQGFSNLIIPIIENNMFLNY